MSGATLAYDLRRNKHVERQLFMELLSRFARWRDIYEYLYIGFGGVYFEEFKLLHTRFRINKMISLEREKWMLPRQELNVPYGCITPLPGTSDELALKLDDYRYVADASGLLIWLDYVTARDLATYLDEVRSIVAKLENGDILKVTLSLSPGWLNQGPSNDVLSNRLENLRNHLGSPYLAQGITIHDVTNDGLPNVYLGALQRKIAEALTENPTVEFLPLGCYTYKDSTAMLTVTGALVARTEVANFVQRTELGNLELCSPNWELHDIELPDLSLRERLELDRRITGKSAEEIGAELGFQFEEDEDESLMLIRNYLKFYRYYPNYHRVQF